MVVPPHAHHAVQVTLGLTGPVRLREEDGDWVESDGGAVRPNTPHAFDGGDSTYAMLFVDPECHEGRWLRHSLVAPVMAIPAVRYADFRQPLLDFRVRRPSAVDASSTIRGVVHALCEGPPPSRPMDERIARAVTYVRGRDARGLSTESVAKEVFLSPSRFAHLFTEEMGLPFRRYLLWRKLSRAFDGFGRGSSLSTAAHSAGFSDSAHLTRTFYQMFGLAPSVMLGTGDFYEIPPMFGSESTR